jgi:hypothetical protein
VKDIRLLKEAQTEAIREFEVFPLSRFVLRNSAHPVGFCSNSLKSSENDGFKDEKMRKKK